MFFWRKRPGRHLAEICAGLAVAVGLALGCAEEKKQVIGEVIPEEAYHMMREHRDRGDPVVLDIRTPEEFARGRIAGARNIDYYSASFRKEIEGLDKERIYIIYCRRGERSEKALTIFQELGFREVYHILWGIEAWKEDGLPVTKGKSGAAGKAPKVGDAGLL